MCVCQKCKALNLSDYIYIYSNSVIYKCFINQQTDIPIFSSLLNVKHQKKSILKTKIFIKQGCYNNIYLSNTQLQKRLKLFVLQMFL